jgi:hypothetical protein
MGRRSGPPRFLLANLIFQNATVGTASGALADVGITDRFMKELATVLIPSRSPLFVLTRKPTSDKDRVLERDNRIRSMKRACLFDPNFRSTSLPRDFTRSRDEREGTRGKAISVKLRTNTTVATLSNAATLVRNCVVRSAVRRL